jgi:hypothetical protein
MGRAAVRLKETGKDSLLLIGSEKARTISQTLV